MVVVVLLGPADDAESRLAALIDAASWVDDAVISSWAATSSASPVWTSPTVIASSRNTRP